MSLRMAKPKLAAVAGSKPPNCGIAEPKLLCGTGMSQVAGRCGRRRESRPIDRRSGHRRRGATAGRAAYRWPELSSMLKSKSTPIRSKKLSLSVMNRTSIVTCKSCRRRKLLQQVGDLLVHFLRLADDQAQVRLEPVRSSRGRRLRPRLCGLTVAGDQLDQRIEVGLPPPPMPPGPPRRSAFGRPANSIRHRPPFGPAPTIGRLG